ncbi:ragulator complex protein LAMTOR4 homolog [Sitodiplosis mosellana]|uniref:ragulator complex protein LAMTOR4 homolog n=1 Tax=Sitodiplosis mosellana TaxID=263140 RepID=UPI002444ACE4|nr:ragulator complex protein LAMTOR4 homolog [Sitodiplosis mosellana]
MVSFAKIPDLVGYLVLTEYGAVLESDGDLKNDENCANIVTSIINLADSADENTLPKSDCHRISIVFENHSYTICLSNKKIYVAKRAVRGVNSQQSSPPTAIGFQPENKGPNLDSTTQQSSA